jgi:hypothetical protein
MEATGPPALGHTVALMATQELTVCRMAIAMLWILHLTDQQPWTPQSGTTTKVAKILGHELVRAEFELSHG